MTFSDLVREAREQVLSDSRNVGGRSDDHPHTEGNIRAYADAVATYLAFGVDKMTDTNSTLCTWQVDPPRLRATFGRQALPMTWDIAEANPFADAAGDYQRAYGSLCEVLDELVEGVIGSVIQLDASACAVGNVAPFISTDPPYYDNIGYADLSDYFYIWLLRTLGFVYPQLFATVLTPKGQEMIASPYRRDGSKDKARAFFEEQMGTAFRRMREIQDPGLPLTVFYAFKQSETEDTDTSEALPQTNFRVATGI